MSFGLLKKSRPEKVQRRSQESPLRRVQPRPEMDEEELDCYSRGILASVQSRRRPRRDQEARRRDENILSVLKLKIPPFHGKNDPDVYLEWEKKTELVFDSKNYSELKKVRKATYEFYGYANTWWDQLVTIRRRNGKNPVKTWAEMKSVMRKRFVPCGYHQEQHYVDTFRKLEDLMLEYLQGEQQQPKKRNTKPKVEAKPPTEVAKFVEQSDHEEVIAVQENLQSALTAEEENQGQNVQGEEAEVVFDSLSSSEKKEEAMKQSLGSIDDSADEFTERYSLSPTLDPYILDFELLEEVDGDKMLLSVQYECEIQEVEHVDFVFGDAAFCKPESKAMIFDFVIQGNGEQTQGFDLLVNKGDFLDFSRNKSSKIRVAQRKHGSFELVLENGVSKLFSLYHYMILKGLNLRDFRKNHLHSPRKGIGVEVRRQGPIVDKVKDGRKAIELGILDDCGVMSEPRMHKARRAIQVLISSGVIKLPKLRCLKLMKCLSHPFDPGIKI